MTADFEEVKNTLMVLFAPGATVEMRCVGNGKTINGYYPDLEKLASDACRLNTDFSPRENVFVCLNRVDPQLYARRADQFGAAGKNTGAIDNSLKPSPTRSIVR